MATKRAGKRPGLEEQLAELGRACEAPDSPAAAEALRAALGSKHSVLVAAAAKAIATHELSGFDAELSGAFERFMEAPEKTDKNCLAKTAIMHALYRLEAPADEVYLRGVRHVQLEPVWGGKQDTAVELRVTSGLGLARRRHPATLDELARLLADAEVMARIGAANAIGYSGHSIAGVPLLRFKIHAGDADARVTGACMGGLLALEPQAALGFADELLRSDDAAVVEAVAVALGESRLDGAFPLLRRVCEEAVTPESRAAAMLALAMLRSEPAWSFLLEVVASESEHRARAALKALSIFASQPELAARVAETLQQRSEPELKRAARELWGDAI